MSEYSRIKKYQSLRNEIENDSEKELVSPALSSYAQRLNRINPIISNIKAQEATVGYEAIHKKRENAYQTKDQLSEPSHAFNDDLMGEFLSEVKAYNLEKGYRKTEDTSKDILKPIKTSSEPISHKNAVNQQESFDITLEEDQEKIRKLIESDFEEDEVMDTNDEFEANSGIQLVVEETQKLKLQISEYEKGLIDMNNSVLSSNRLLNFLIFVLVLVLMIMLGIAIYWVLYSQGLN